ncbi:MAG TPA: M23 family metallopeptidase [Methylomirabilota bacterium]
MRRRTFLLGAALLGIPPAASVAAGAPGGVRVSATPPSPQPGDVLLLQVTGAPPNVRAEWDGRPLALFPTAHGVAALIGIDLDVRPGPMGWRLTRPSVAKNGGALAAGVVHVRARTFPMQQLTLPKGMVDLDAPTLVRVESERAALKAALAAGVRERLWRGPFRTPVEGGQPTGGFGLRRLINGQPRSPHTGYDWAAPAGTPVLAANAGRAALVAEHFFAGRNVVLDHGLGLFTFYFHLTEARVAEGETVAEGQVIGTVGASGRVTGPHLHFAVQLGGARVDPESLLRLVPPEDASP